MSMPSPHISFVPLLLAPLVLLAAACVHSGGGASAHPGPAEAAPATPAPAAAPAAPPTSPPPRTSCAGRTRPRRARSAPPTAARLRRDLPPHQARRAAHPPRPNRRRPRRQPPRERSRRRPPRPQHLRRRASAAAPAAKPAATAAAALDLSGLEQRLRDTRAIGVFTKLSLKNQVDDLLGEFRTYHKGRTPPTLTQLRQQYEVLLMKVVTLLQDGDPSLAGAVTSSREAIWGVLTDPVKFANI